MENLVQFTPIFRQDPENIKNYYKDNNIELPDNPYFKNLIGIDESNEVAYENYVDESPKKKKLFDKKDLNNLSFIYPPKKEKEENEDEKPLNSFVSKDFDIKSNNVKEILEQINKLQINEEDKEYLVKLAEKESSFRPNVVNQFGYKGLYQFGNDALSDIGYTKKDLENIETQHLAALSYANLNEKKLKPIINSFVGKTYKGSKITLNGLRAAAHLLGAQTVKDYFLGTNKSPYSKKGFVDGNGTHITKYLEMYT